LKRYCRLFSLGLLIFCASAASHAQGNATDARAIQLYGFGGGTGVYTGLNGGHNIGVTAGVDLGFGAHYGFLPMLEVRGTYPVDSGTIVNERNFLGGVHVDRQYRAAHPYVDLLYGRGQLQYQGIGQPYYTDPNFNAIRENSNIYSLGGGVDYDVTQSFAAKVDLQLQHYGTKVTASGSINSTLITIGVVYRFGYKQKHIY
jgi:opacity protein-like surface antigen